MTTATVTRWKVDPAHTTVEFTVRHMMISTVRGRFRKFEGTILGDPSDLARMVFEGDVDAASVDTAEPQRDEHLRSPDFFDVARFPRITFRSKDVRRLDGDEYEVLGDLTIRGVTREVPFRVRFLGAGKDPWGQERIGLEAEARINREDFGLTWNALLETGGVLVSKDVKIELQIQAVKEAAA